jgi:hemolysin activation/secretion protein
VRGYQEGEEFGDTGWRVLIEPRTPSVDIGMVDGTRPMLLRGSIFTDYGEVYSLNRQSRQDRIRMWGAGFGVVGSIGQTFNFRLTLAWALRDTAKSNAGGARAYFGISAQF